MEPGDIQFLPSSDHIDLHSFVPAEVPAVVEEYLRQCQADGLTEVRLIHGKGKGVQRARVQHLLERLDLVAAFADAPPEHGHWGATIVWLHPPQVAQLGPTRSKRPSAEGEETP